MRTFLLVVSTLLIASCASSPKIPPELIYSPPAGPAGSVATIKGMIVKTKMPLFDNFNTYVYAIDGKRVVAEKKQWAQPVSLTSGTRTITVGFERGVYVAFAKVDASIEPGGSYQVRSACPQSPIGRPFSYCDFWVIDASNDKPASEIMRAVVRGGGPLIFTY